MDIRDRIIEHSTALFVAHGLRSVRMDDIAAELGISKRTLYEAFGDKEALIEACVKHFFDCKMVRDRHRSAGANNVVEEMLLNLTSGEEIVRRSFTLMNDLRKFYPEIHRRLADQSIELSTRELREKLRRGIEQGLVFPALEIDLAVRLLIDFEQAVFARLNTLPDTTGESMARTLRHCVILFARGVATQQGIAMIDDYMERNQIF